MLLFSLPKSLCVCLVVIMSLLLLGTPLFTNLALAKTAYQSAATACMDAERQAESDINGTTWFAIGCLAGLIGYIIALSEPNPPATHLLGKSPEYVALYTDCYRKKGKSIKSKNALYGCLAGTGLTVLLYVIIFVALADNSSNDEVVYYY